MLHDQSRPDYEISGMQCEISGMQCGWQVKCIAIDLAQFACSVVAKLKLQVASYNFMGVFSYGNLLQSVGNRSPVAEG